MSRRRLPPRASERGQSVAINYTLSLVIVTMMISGLFIGMSGFLDDEREHVTRSEFDVLGNRIAADIATADRLASTTRGAGAEVKVRTPIPPRVAGTEYQVTITSTAVGSYFEVEVNLLAPEVGVSRNVSTRTRNNVVASSLDGGPYEVVFDGTEIEVTDD